MTAKWLPVEGGIVPLGHLSGPIQDEERFAKLQGALEDAHGEYRLRRYDAAEERLGSIISAAKELRDGRYSLLMAAAYALQGRIHWRRAERGSEVRDDAVEQEERRKQEASFQKAIELFEANQKFISVDLPESRLRTDHAIALFRTKQSEAAITLLERTKMTGVMSADSFAYLGMAYRERADHGQAVDALKKGLQLAPGDKVLLETLAGTLEEMGNRSEALRIYCKAAIAAGKNDDLATAQMLLRSGLKIEPDDAQALSMLTMLLRSQDDDVGAKKLLDATLERFPASAWALGLRGMILRDQGNIDAALKDFGRVQVESRDLAWIALEHAKAVASSDSSKANELVEQASELLGEGDTRVSQVRGQVAIQNLARAAKGLWRAAAKSDFVRKVADLTPTIVLDGLKELAKYEPELDHVEVLRKMVERFPENVDAREEFAVELFREKNYVETIAQVDAALALAPDSASLLSLKARALDAKGGDVATAVRFYRRASRADRADDGKFDALIDALVRADRRDEALKEVERRLALYKDNGRALATKGDLLFNAGGRVEEAAAALQAAEPHVPDDLLFKVRLRLALSLRELDRYGEALRAVDRAAEVDNALGDARAYKVTFLVEIAEYEQAVVLLQQEIDRLSTAANDDETTRRLGALWLCLGVVQRFIDTTPSDQLTASSEKAFALDPDHPYAKFLLGWVLMRHSDSKKKEEGERLVGELINQHADIPKELLAWCHFLLKQYDVAEHWFRSVVTANPTNIGTHFDLALTLLAMRQDSAATEYARASKLARKKSKERRRGLFDVALSDLIHASKEERVDSMQANRIARFLSRRLPPGRFSNFPTDMPSSSMLEEMTPKPADD